jgi:regulator of replication initiation timing
VSDAIGDIVPSPIHPPSDPAASVVALRTYISESLGPRYRKLTTKQDKVNEVFVQAMFTWAKDTVPNFRNQCEFLLRERDRPEVKGHVETWFGEVARELRLSEDKLRDMTGLARRGLREPHIWKLMADHAELKNKLPDVHRISAILPPKDHLDDIGKVLDAPPQPTGPKSLKEARETIAKLEDEREEEEIRLTQKLRETDEQLTEAEQERVELLAENAQLKRDNAELREKLATLTLKSTAP